MKRNIFTTILNRVRGFVLIIMNECSLGRKIYDHRDVIKKTVTENFIV